MKQKNNYRARKEAIQQNPTTAETRITTQSVSTNLVKQQSEIQIGLRKTNQKIIEQPKDGVLQHLRAKLIHEEYCENVLQQDARYRHYANN